MSKKATNLQLPMHKFKYSDFLDKAIETGWTIVPYFQLFNKPGDKMLYLGHRVTGDGDKTKRVARMEFEKGIKSTYFLLTTADEFVSDGMLYFNYLNQLMHEGNLLVDCIDLVTRFGQNVHDHIIHNVLQLNRFNIASKGIAMYNDSDIARKSNFSGVTYFYDYTNEEGYLRLGSNMQKDILINFGVHPLAEYGLLYEDRRVKTTHTITDDKGLLTIDDKVCTRKKAKEDLFTFLENDTGTTAISFNLTHWNV
jgi:hypothetical protein